MKENCQDCQLYRHRENIVWGEGDKDSATQMIVGEAPGQKEDETGRPFVGRSGQLLRDMLKEADILQCSFITNTVKCRPPDNRDPREEEREECEKYLVKQVQQIDPDRIIAVGRLATQQLTGEKKTLGEFRNEDKLWCRFAPVEVVPIYHPSYLLRRGKPEDLIQEEITRLKINRSKSSVYKKFEEFRQ